MGTRRWTKQEMLLKERIIKLKVSKNTEADIYKLLVLFHFETIGSIANKRDTL